MNNKIVFPSVETTYRVLEATGLTNVNLDRLQNAAISEFGRIEKSLASRSQSSSITLNKRGYVAATRHSERFEGTFGDSSPACQVFALVKNQVKLDEMISFSGLILPAQITGKLPDRLAAWVKEKFSN